ncbi:trehalose-6-phosphate synthase [Hoeflea sp. 108]|jgi:trehalose 6-phosphate synthase/phosphatase|uniref:alpha,alpha-trehalose-phosphate synthase (UDP-forming) n=1 Tax=Hoeflea sp. 108 TaxID=1116369 RepID=UPI00036A1823|nr:trehalose-6-phosphate synthase [Hoeflea sp. 108]
MTDTAFLTLAGLAAVTLLVSAVALWFSISAMRRGPASKHVPPPEQPANAQLLPEFEQNSRPSETPHITWSPQMMRQVIARDLPEAEIILVSNREPYIHDLRDGEVEMLVPASGLVSALEPVMRACAGTWIAHGGGSADHLVVDEHDRIDVPPGRPAYTLSRVWLSEEEQNGYYLGFANDGLWPLCHIAFTRPVFRASDWEAYKAVNQKFADRVVKEARTSDPVVLVQDYHFALLPRMVREKLPDATIITFWHIPWPNSEVFSICPWREQILDGLLGSSVVGFHIQFHCNNFTESVDRFLESRIEREHSSISYGAQTTLVHPYPISIEWPPTVLENQPSVQDCRDRLTDRFNLPAGTRLLVGVERLDYTKGIIDRFLALEQLFLRHPEWLGKLVFVQIAAPSRGTLPAYKHLHDECRAFVEAFNERFGHQQYQPILLLDQHHNQGDIYSAYRAADACVVSSLHDGMNLVAKEFVASRDDEQGVLILSTFAGASRELLDALIVNPFDPTAMGDAMLRAITMSADEQRDRMIRLRDVVRTNNVYRWAGTMLQDAARLRLRQRAMDADGGSMTATPSNKLTPALLQRLFRKPKSLRQTLERRNYPRASAARRGASKPSAGPQGSTPRPR